MYFGKHPATTPISTDMSPKWTTRAQEEFLESKYRDYLKLKNRHNRTAFKDFWETVKAEWTALFGWRAEDEVQAKAAPSLEKVSNLYVINSKQGTD